MKHRPNLRSKSDPPSDATRRAVETIAATSLSKLDAIGKNIAGLRKELEQLVDQRDRDRGRKPASRR